MFYQEETTNIWNLYQKCQLVMWVDHLFPLQFAKNGKQTISYRSVQKLDGNKPPIVFLHGIGSGSGSWAPIMSLLKEQYLPIAWDAPGYNKSTHLTKQNPQSIDYSQTLLDFTKLLNLQPYAVIGHSLGALMAVCYAINHLPNLPKLILANPANGYGNEKNEVRKAKLNGRLDMVRELGTEKMAAERSSALLSSSASSEALELVEWNMKKVTKTGYEQAAHTLANGDLIGMAGKYNGEVHIISSSGDNITPVSTAEKIAKSFEGSSLEILPGLGHASYVEDANIFSKSLLKFLKSN